MFCDTRTPFSTFGATSGYHAFFRTLILGESSYLGGIYNGNIVANPVSSSSSDGVVFGAFFLQFPKHFHINEPSGSGGNLT